MGAYARLLQHDADGISDDEYDDEYDDANYRRGSDDADDDDHGNVGSATSREG